ncbi:tyrosine-protein phosphatase [Kitasatospora sp. NPDC096147]|uniref:tyrosine-protein phosphatase n=1 Tax=Kitasatospora sp. NPDC096147 TaxID=3364093 RepID=UPI0037FACC12
MIRHLEFDRLRNFRDLGGYTTTEGRRVRPATLYRSDSLGKLTTEADLARFAALGIGTVIDLRYPWEIERGGRVPDFPGLTFHNHSIEHHPYDQAALGADVDPAVYLVDKYLEVAEEGTAELRRALQVIADPAAGRTVFHCASGKDRTGIVGALVLTVLGVPPATVEEDFALTNLATDALAADWQAKYGPGPLWPGYGQAPAALIRSFLAELTARHGSVAGYLAGPLGLGDEYVAALRERLLEPLAP